jgi:hypothetical protein
VVTAARRLQHLQRVRRLRHLRQRARERGATLFVVVLVMTLLLGIGAYAARSAQLATAASGSERQMVQARYVAEYGLMFATAKLSNPAAQSFLYQMGHPQPATLCYGQNAAMPSRSCYQMLAADITQELGTSYNVCDPVNAGNPGSLGMSNTECDFRVELSDLSEGVVVPGNAKSALKFWYVTGTSTGQVRIVNTGGGVLDAKSAESTQTQTLRSRILVGPISIPN